MFLCLDPQNWTFRYYCPVLVHFTVTFGKNWFSMSLSEVLVQRIHKLENCTLLEDDTKDSRSFPLCEPLYWSQLWHWVTSLAEVSGMSPLVSIPGEYHW